MTQRLTGTGAAPTLRRTLATQVREAPGIERLPRRPASAVRKPLRDLLSSVRVGKAVPLSDAMPERGPFQEARAAKQ